MITPFGLRHIGLLREMQNDSVTLDVKSSLRDTETPLRIALRGYFAPSRAGNYTHVLHAPDRGQALRGFAQVNAHKSGLSWTIVRMAPQVHQLEDAASTIWYRLLLHLCIAAGERQVQRLFAALPEGHPADEVFRQASFAAYCREHMFRLPEAAAAQGQLSARIRPASADNAFDIQKLYYRITPRLVLQTAEPNGQPGGSSLLDVGTADAPQGYVLYGAKSELAGYMYFLWGARGWWLRLIADRDAGDSIGEMLDHALALLSNHAPRPIYCALREYEGGVQAPLADRGFVLTDTYRLMVKHTTVQVKVPKRKLVPAMEKRAEIAPTISQSNSKS